jgi:hypothetical protein
MNEMIKVITIQLKKINIKTTRKENLMEMRNWLLGELVYVKSDYEELLKLINHTSDDSLEGILGTHFSECIFNIQRNFDFLRTIITRKKSPGEKSEQKNSLMNNEEIDKHLKKYAHQLMGYIAYF